MNLKLLKKIFSFFYLEERCDINFDINYSPEVTISENLDLIITLPQSKIYGNKDKAFAYLSFSEIEQNTFHQQNLPEDIILGKNNYWNTYIVNPTSKNWKRYLIKKVEEISDLGYQNIFIDTVDSLEKFLTPHKFEKSVQLFYVLKKIIKGKIILNRGMWLYKEIKDKLWGILLESLFFSKGKDGSWRHNSPREIEYLLGWIKQYHIDKKYIFSVDYAPEAFKKEKELKKKAKKYCVNWMVKEEHLGNV